MEAVDFTIFDAFVRESSVYLITSIINREVNESELIVSMGGNVLRFQKKYVKNEYEPILIFVYDAPDVGAIRIVFETTIVDIMPVTVHSHYLTLTTLFKDDYQLFPVFYQYYKEQGVDHFYMYYNGIITEDVRKLLDYDDVTLIEWNFRYWNSSSKYLHHAQLGQMHSALHKYGKRSTYMIFCDLDEYLHVEGTLRKYVASHSENKFGFCNVWSQTVDNKIPAVFPSTFLVERCKSPYGDRSKNIYKTSEFNLISIHKAISSSAIVDLTMFHFYNWSQPDRHREMDRTITALSGSLLEI